MKEIKFFIVEKHNVKDALHYIINQKSNAIMNMKLEFPLNLISRFKAIILEFIIVFFFIHKERRTPNFVSLYRLIFGHLLKEDHYLLKVIFDFFMRKLKR